MAASEQTEIERKYDVDESARVPDLTVVQGVAAAEEHGTFTLTAVYYDTNNLNLAAHSISLRRREGGTDEGWHIKKPVAEGRTELHWPLDTVNPIEPADHKLEELADEVPDVVLEPVRAIVRGHAVTPVARVTTTRTTVHMMNDRGEAVAELADDQVLASDIRGGEVRTWREWEVEFLEAAPDTPEERTAFLDAVEQVITEVGARPSESRSKLAHTLGAQSLSEVRAGNAAPGRESRTETDTDAGSAGSVVVAAVHQQVDALVEADPAVRADEPDAVHRMRRTVRRLRSLLATYGSLFDEEPVDQLRDDLKRFGAALGEARDAEVRRNRATKLLESLPSQDPSVHERLIGGDQREYDEAIGRLRHLMTGQHYYRLLDMLDQFVQSPPLSDRASRPAAKEIRKAVLRQVKRMNKRAEAVGALAGDGGGGDRTQAGGNDTPNSDVTSGITKRQTAMHEVRKAARRLRYAVTALEVPGGYKPDKKLRRIASTVKPLEKALGEYRDAVLFAQQVQLAAQRARAEGEDTYIYGLLTGSAVDATASGGDAGGAGDASHTESQSSEDHLIRDIDKTESTVDKLARQL